MTWLAIGALGAALAIAAMAFAYAAWVSKRGATIIDDLNATHTGFRETAVVLEAARGEIKALHEKLSEAAAALVNERDRHREETAVIRNRLKAAEERLAAVDTPDGIAEGLSRRGGV